MVNRAETGQICERVVTTREFIASLCNWQYAVAAASAAPHPTYLASWVDFERAAVDPSAAKEWADFLAKVERGMSELIADAVKRGQGDTVAVSNARSLLDRVTSAHRLAAEHAKSFGCT